MIHLLVPTCAVLGGSAAALKIVFVPAQTVQKLAEQLDCDLAGRLFALEEAGRDAAAWSPAQARAYFQAIGGVRGIPHLLAQTRLLLRIVTEIRKARPDDFEIEEKWLDGALLSISLGTVAALLESTIAVLIPHLRCIGARVTTTIFAHLSAQVEVMQAEFQYEGCS